jgi:conjugative transfer signal peptidase TraF
MTAKCGLRRFALLLSAVTSAGFIAGLVGIRVNTSSSLPLGLYVRTSDPTAMLVEFCPAEPFASFSQSRGYRVAGFSCPDRAVPLLKPVVAHAGDAVEVSVAGIAINGRLLPNTSALTRDAAGRSLTPWPSGQYIVEPGFVWVASTYSKGSYDSRYIGPVEEKLIRGRLKPLWLLR